MLKRFFFSFMILIAPAILFSQQLEIKGTGTNFYLEHSVAPQESFYSIGRLYNLSPRDLAAYNSLSFEGGLNIGQRIRIPLTADNFTQATVKSAAEALVPLYHTVASGETLYRLGVNYKNVDLAKIRQWNALPGDNVSQGAHMIVGFLRVNKSESALASRDFNSPGSATTVSNQPAATPQAVTTPKPAEPRREAPAKSEPVASAQVPATPTPVVQTELKDTEKSGFFRSEYVQRSGATPTTTAGSAAVFKSTSGWQDRKYYCFNNDAAPGSIIRVSVSGSADAIYAKVLDAIPDIKQNEGLKLVLSNAAADALGVSGEKFQASIQFYK